MIKVFIAHPAFLVLTKIIQLIYFGELGEWIIFVKFLQASTKGTTDHLQQRPHLSSRTVKKTHLHLITKPLFCYPDLCGVKSIIGVCVTQPFHLGNASNLSYKRSYKLQVVCSQLTNDRHSFSIAVEIQDSKDIVGFFNPHFTYRDGILCPWEKNVAKVSGCRNQGPFVWGGCLVIDLPCIVDTVKRKESQGTPEHYRGTQTPQLKTSHPFFAVDRGTHNATSSAFLKWGPTDCCSTQQQCHQRRRTRDSPFPSGVLSKWTKTLNLFLPCIKAYYSVSRQM